MSNNPVMAALMGVQLPTDVLVWLYVDCAQAGFTLAEQDARAHTIDGWDTGNRFATRNGERFLLLGRHEEVLDCTWNARALSDFAGDDELLDVSYFAEEHLPSDELAELGLGVPSLPAARISRETAGPRETQRRLFE